MGVFSKDLTLKLAKVLQNMGAEHVLVVHGADGLDEISFTGDTFIAELKDGKVTEYTVNPTQFGLKIHALKSIRVENAAQSKAMILDVLDGKAGAGTQSAAREIVLLNAGAAIYVAGLQPSIHAGIEHAAQVIDNGLAKQKLDELVRLSR